MEFSLLEQKQAQKINKHAETHGQTAAPTKKLRVRNVSRKTP